MRYDANFDTTGHVMLYVNGSMGRTLTENVIFDLTNLEILGAPPGTRAIDVVVGPGDSRLIVVHPVDSAQGTRWGRRLAYSLDP